MKVAAAQTLVSSDITENAKEITDILAQAAAENVRLVLFCEGALSGYAKSQIPLPDQWEHFDWHGQSVALKHIAERCKQLGIYAAVGAVHRLKAASRPHNCVYVISEQGELVTRYDKRFLSHTEINDWYAPGYDAVTFEVDNYSFGIAICIESQFAEVFMEYERLGVDAVLFASYGIPEHFQVALAAHAGLNCIWIVAATATQKAQQGQARILGPNGHLLTETTSTGFAASNLDRENADFEIALHKARPWRAAARRGEIYRARQLDDPRSRERQSF